MLKIELSQSARDEATHSLRQYFAENMAEPLGELPAGLLLNYILEEIGPAIYNRAISDAQTRMQSWVMDLNGELYFPEFPYWPQVAKKRRPKK